MDDQSLEQALMSLEQRVNVTGGPPPFRRRSAVRGKATVLVAALAVALVGGVVTASGLFTATGRPGAFNPGQPLHCSGVAAMDPVTADAWLRDHGYDVTWQIEDVTPSEGKPGPDSSRQSDTPPAQGKIAGAVITNSSRHELIVVVEIGEGARGTDDCQ